MPDGMEVGIAQAGHDHSGKVALSQTGAAEPGSLTDGGDDAVLDEEGVPAAPGVISNHLGGEEQRAHGAPG